MPSSRYHRPLQCLSKSLEHGCAAALAEQYPGTARWEDVLTHLAQRLEWLELGLHMDVFTQRSMHADAAAFNAAADEADLLLAVDVKDVAWATELVRGQDLG